MSVARRCGYCQQPFQPSSYRPQQMVCSHPDCQRRRRSDYHRDKIQTDPEYRQVCLDSPRKWRARHADYWRKYREAHPQAVEQNRRKQRDRDQAQRLTNLANNNLASGQMFVLEALVHQTNAAFGSCKQQPSGAVSGSAG